LHTKAPTRNTETIRRLTALLIEAAKPKGIIMFGSQARGEAGEDSDLDVMVVEEGVSDPCRGDGTAEPIAALF